MLAKVEKYRADFPDGIVRLGAVNEGGEFNTRAGVCVCVGVCVFFPPLLLIVSQILHLFHTPAFVWAGEGATGLGVVGERARGGGGGGAQGG